MNISKLLKRPLNNQKGFAIIIMISLISVTVVSYTLYASNYFLLLTHEVKQAKRTINGINVLQQVAQTMYRGRNKHFRYKNGPAVSCAALDPDYPVELHELCVPDLTTKADGLCIANPFVDPPVLCIRNAVNPNHRNILEVTGYKEPTWYDPYVKPLLRDFNNFSYSYGKTMVSLAEELSNRAIAYPEPDELPSLAGAPTLTKNPAVNKPCVNNTTPSEECMRCRDHDAAVPPVDPMDSRRPECFLLKVCVRPDDGVAAGVAGDGFADCDPAINEQWIWQLVAITNPVGP